MIDAYSLVLAGLLVSMGSLGDRIGHRKLLLAGSLGFAIVSVLTAYSDTATQLIAGRACMGVFGAMLMPSTLALIRSVFEDREERRLAVAIWATTLTVGSALGPLVGGVLLEFFSVGGSIFPVGGARVGATAGIGAIVVARIRARCFRTVGSDKHPAIDGSPWCHCLWH